MSDSEFSAPSSSSGSIGGKKSGRGPARGKVIEELIGKIDVRIDDNGQPSSKTSSKLMTWIGVKAKDAHLLPLSYSDWRKVPQPLKDDAVNKIYEKFNLPEDCRRWVEMKLNDRWKHFKHELKVNVFNKYGTHEERLAHLDKRVPLEQWSILLETWSQEASQAMSARNIDNRKNLKSLHNTGRTSFAVIRERKRQGHANKEPPTRMEMFKITRDPADEIANVIIANMEKKLNEFPKEMRADPAVQDQVFRDCVGDDVHGRVRMCGVGLTPTQVHGTTREQNKSYAKENAELRAKVHTLEATASAQAEKISAQDEKIASQDEQISSLQAGYSSLEAGYSSLRADLQSLMQGQRT